MSGNYIIAHRLPNNSNTRDQWLMFIYLEITQQFSSTLTLPVCPAHFTSDCFVNQAQFKAGFSKKLLIKDTTDQSEERLMNMN